MNRPRARPASRPEAPQRRRDPAAGSVRRRDDRGAATVMVLALLGAVTLTAVLAATLGTLVVGHRRVQAAADLAALAAAVAVQQGHDGCAAAARLATRNRATLLACAVRGEVGSVTVGLDLDHLPLPTRRVTLRAQARAGPVHGEAGRPVAVR